MFRTLTFTCLLSLVMPCASVRAVEHTDATKNEAPAGAYQYHGNTYVPSGPQWLIWSKEINGSDCPAEEPYAINPAFQTASFGQGQLRPMESQTRTSAKVSEDTGATDALDEVNAYRARHGLHPFMRDEGLSVAAGRAAAFRARHRVNGHVMGGMGDFQFVPPGTIATSAACAAWPPKMGWGSCCARDNYRYAGAAWAMGPDGLRYMHLYVR
ncbi:MAG: hypothetical protein ACJ8C4_19915 [Gemmataceae bacterium]